MVSDLDVADVNVGIDQAGHERLAREVKDPAGGGLGLGSIDLPDHTIGHDHRNVLARLRPRAVNQERAPQDQRVAHADPLLRLLGVVPG